METLAQIPVASKALSAALAALNDSNADAIMLAKCRAVVRAYHQVQWPRFSAAQIIAVEEEFSFPLQNPETSAYSRTFAEAGKIDGRFVEAAQNKILEHKTTADTIEPGAHYWNRLEMDTQASKYFLAQMRDGWTPVSILYDVIRRPAHRPKAIPELDNERLKIVTDDATGARVINKNGTPRQTAGEGMTIKSRQETVTEFEGRLFDEIMGNKDKFFATFEITRLESDILEYMQDAWSTGQQILYWRRANLWPRNPDSCTAWGACPYIALCLKRAEVDGIQYVRDGRRTHPELSTDNAGDLELLTNTRAARLRKCPRLHFWQHEDKVFPTVEDKEALQFGRLIHAALEAWLKTIQEAQSGE